MSRCILQIATLGAPALQCLKLPLCLQVLSLQCAGHCLRHSPGLRRFLPELAHPSTHHPACFPLGQSSFLFLATPSTPYLGALWHWFSSSLQVIMKGQDTAIGLSWLLPRASFKRDKAYLLSPSVCPSLPPLTLLHTDLVRLSQEPLYHSFYPRVSSQFIPRFFYGALPWGSALVSSSMFPGTRFSLIDWSSWWQAG